MTTFKSSDHDLYSLLRFHLAIYRKRIEKITLYVFVHVDGVTMFFNCDHQRN
jgi:hypothetical protein